MRDIAFSFEYLILILQVNTLVFLGPCKSSADREDICYLDLVHFLFAKLLDNSFAPIFVAVYIAGSL